MICDVRLLKSRSIRKRTKARFYNQRPYRRKKHATNGQLDAKSSPHPRGTAIFGLRFRRKKARLARLAISGGRRRLPPYINALLNAKKGNRRPLPETLCSGYRAVECGDQKLPDFSGGIPPDIGFESENPSVALSENVVVVVQRPEATPHEGRQSMAISALEEKITEAIRGTPGCEAFIGVVLMKVKPSSSFEANWGLRGVKYGRTDRDIVNRALNEIVHSTKKNFELEGAG
jgi:hypothetical protein